MILHCLSLVYQTILSKSPLFVMNIAATGYVLKQTFETYLAFHDALLVKKHLAELVNLLTTYEPNGTAIDMTIATLKRHKVAVLAAVTSPYSNGPIEGITRLIKSLK